ncbi:MAG: alpha-galactosidase [Selenomonas sp.]|uniref:alpha-galactosidase n=1 Tax=Selenomonas sp. TaxID=2053611 RepID=UPI0025CF2E05|nr:alpha-galactosidase [Selenomonas sp.]MCI6086843.1 alpha-galactosidase [Selenomonas sp.]
MITFDETNHVFHLKNDRFSYCFSVERGKYLLHQYFGRPLRAFRGSAERPAIDRGFSPQPGAYENERTFSLDVVPQEFATNGHGDFRIPSLDVVLENGTNVVELWYEGYEIKKGKPKLEGLPVLYAKGDEAETLEVTLTDTHGRMKAILSYTVFASDGVLTRSVRYVNTGSESLRLENAASLCLDFPDHDFDRLSLYGGHAAERSLERIRLMRGVQLTGSLRGASSHQQSPFLALTRPNTDELAGDVYGFSFIYSGSFRMATEVEQFGTTRVVVGINPDDFAWTLAPGEAFQTPEVVIAYAHDGLNGMSQAFHRAYREHLLRGKYQHAVRPILVNNWEATYFDFDDQKLDDLAACAADLGIELMVLDDGWFGHREDDNSSLGDWQVNRAKLKGGLEGVAASAHKRGLKFGLWFEPEMISKDSDLYRAHPDWALHVPDYPSSFSRHQLVLDLSRQEVQDYIVKSVCDILATGAVDYVKWDFNRHLTEAFSAGRAPEHQRETKHRFVLGLYAVLERITQAYPDVLFESCSGGGGRFDAAMLYYMPQTWTSDDTDAICRLAIQTGTSYAFPPITMGAHVSVTPNHQVGRVTPMQTRAFAAMMGCYGYEMDITRMSDAEKQQVKEHIALYKRLRPTIQLGTFTRLLSPFEGTRNETAWMFTSEDGSEIALFYFKALSEPCTPIRRLRLVGLDADAEYKVAAYYPAQSLSHDSDGSGTGTLVGRTFYGDELMQEGLNVAKINTDFAAYLWVLEKAD